MSTAEAQITAPIRMSVAVSDGIKRPQPFDAAQPDGLFRTQAGRTTIGSAANVSKHTTR